MDFDAFSNAHHHQWDRLRELAHKRKLTGEEADELIVLYNATATHLSVLRSSAPDPSKLQELSVLLAHTRSRIVGAKSNSLKSVLSFFTTMLPAAMYRTRWWTHGVTLACVVIAIAFGVLVASSESARSLLGTEEDQLAYVNHHFADYYTPGFDFATRVFTNNGWIALQSVALGITGIGPAYVLLQNAVNVGQVGGLMVHFGEGTTFFSLILPHGFLELTAIFMAGGAGLKLFWVLVKPGRVPRSLALAQEGRSLVIVALGTVIALLASGVVEGFITGSGLVWWLKILIGALVLGAFWFYVYFYGGRAVRAGHTGDANEESRGFTQIYA